MKQLYENTWAEMDVGVRIFLLAGEKAALVIRSVDAGVCRFLIGRRSDDHIG